MNNRRDFEIARKGWYRIPVKHAPPSATEAVVLAFYFTKAFPEGERWHVVYYAPVLRYRIVRRRELLPEEADHPRADEQYYKVEIGPLERLPRPIPSRRLRRITFIPTTLDRLLSAQEINDLWLGDAVEERLWRAFQKNGIIAERRCRLWEDREGEEEIDLALFCRQGKIAVLCAGGGPLEGVPVVRERPLASEYDLTAAGWMVLSFTAQQVTESLPDCLAAVREAIARLGGLVEP